LQGFIVTMFLPGYSEADAQGERPELEHRLAAERHILVVGTCDAKGILHAESIQ